jgi:hypothetical protein
MLPGFAELSDLSVSYRVRGAEPSHLEGASADLSDGLFFEPFFLANLLELRTCEVHRHLTLAAWARRQRTLLSRPTAWRRTQLTTTGLPFSLRLELDGTTIVRLIA